MRFGAAGLRRRNLADLALERRLMPFPETQEAHRSGLERTTQGHWCSGQNGSVLATGPAIGGESIGRPRHKFIHGLLI